MMKMKQLMKKNSFLNYSLFLLLSSSVLFANNINECHIQYTKNLNDLKAKCYIQHNKKRLFGLIEDKIIIDYYYPQLFENLSVKNHVFKNECKDNFIQLKREFLEGKVIKCELDLKDELVVLPNNSLRFNLEEFKNQIKKSEQLEIKNIYLKKFNLNLDNNNFSFSISSLKKFNFDEEEVIKRFKLLPLYQKYLVIYNKELKYLGIETTLPVKVIPEKEVMVRGIFKNIDEDEIIIVQKVFKESLKLSISFDQEHTMDKLYKANELTNKEIIKIKDQIIRGIRKGFIKNKSKLSFVSNKQDEEKNYNNHNNKLFLQTILEVHRNNYYDLEYDFDANSISLLLLPIKN